MWRSLKWVRLEMGGGTWLEDLTKLDLETGLECVNSFIHLTIQWLLNNNNSMTIE